MDSKNKKMKFDKSYFIGGAESNYVDYPKRKYKQLAKDIMKNIDINKCIYDYGCAVGKLVKELGAFCFCYGLDISEWAINYGKKHITSQIEILEVIPHIENSIVLFLDVLEHIEIKEIQKILKRLKNCTILVRIPVSAIEGQDFLLDVSKKDKTHIQIHSKTWWRKLFLKYGFEVCNIIDEKAIYDSDGVLAWILKKKK